MPFLVLLLRYVMLEQQFLQVRAWQFICKYLDTVEVTANKFGFYPKHELRSSTRSECEL